MPIFVIQEHHASHLHWDFRFERNGVLKSWAVPKGVPEESGVNRLAVQVDDHVLSWGYFEGVIEEGYGKGTVKIWDRGDCDVETYSTRRIELNLRGHRLKGKYVLDRFSKAGENSWIIKKIEDK